MKKIKIKVYVISFIMVLLYPIFFIDFLEFSLDGFDFFQLSSMNFYHFIFIIFLIGQLYLQLYSKINIQDHYRQLEIFIPLMNDLNIFKKLPNTRGYAASPDFLYSINQIIKNEKPKTVVEAGSGVSTLIASYSFKKYSNDSRIISLDHESHYANKTISEISNHNLEEYANVIHAPLKKYNDSFIWYDTSKIDSLEEIDFLIIDGPPSKGSKDARYPAMPILFDKLSNNAIIILDDSKRKMEKDVVKKWKNDFPNQLQFKYIDNDKGLFIIKKIIKK